MPEDPLDRLTRGLLGVSPIHQDTVGEPPLLPPLDYPRKIFMGYSGIPDDLKSDRLKVKFLYVSMSDAVETVFGKKHPNYFGKKDVTEVRGYSKLLAAAERLQHHGIAPGAWAHWRLEWVKKSGQSRKSYGITRIFQASQIDKWSGWHRSTYDGPQGFTRDYTQAHFEQLHRRQEALDRYYIPQRTNHLLGFPRWYTQIRRAELSKGTVDPLACYPRLKHHS